MNVKQVVYICAYKLLNVCSGTTAQNIESNPIGKHKQYVTNPQAYEDNIQIQIDRKRVY